MSFNPDKLHIECRESCRAKEGFLPRKYTLTHSDSTGDLFLTIDCEYDKNQISKLYTRFMRDEVLAQWEEHEGKLELHIYLHVSGGFIFGWAQMRYKIFKFHMPLVLKAIIYGDKQLFELYPNLNKSEIIVHFNSKNKKYHKMQNYGMIHKYKIT
ncbi:MAG: staygreen family protein [Candidatus Thorarchaeota archaeon]